MPDFDTPEPISVTLEFDLGTARVTASKRTDTVVEVLPSDGADDVDVRAAQQTKVTCSGGKLLVKGPKKRSLFGKSGSLDVTIELPAGSDLLGVSPMADLVCEGRLGECRLKTSLGDIQVDEAAAVDLRTDHGGIGVNRVTGDAEIAGAGRIDIGEIAGAALVKNLNGESVIGEIAGDLKASSSNGRISVDTARASVEAKCANGAIRIGEAARGRIMLQAAVGDIEVGIPESTAAWLDVQTRFGKVRNSLGPSEGPGDAGSTVEVRARTGVGDIIIGRP
ncbi:DUF4097 family beta strand repeat-containing protein [Streptomyces halobius]|uniref:DUF4097 family beta strand repeat-containing protein n=1 Tax=Streptomyces halobius TaxID=2879846 RepID=A0ABY4M9F4_9ACTN|nr:DUF4097 family beta strand repeat-containing protein [Streptomyces halobius]UQA94414.1 DUF4097 family beta strand repeat-containing protein [Streptomyces halobius]